jgi:hypothetical protein
MTSAQLTAGSGRTIIMRRLRRCTALLALLTISCALSAQTGNEELAQPKPLRFDFTALVGYRTWVSSLIQPEAAGSHSRIVFDANPTYGLAFGVRLDEENLVEFRWARQDTHSIWKMHHKLPPVSAYFWTSSTETLLTSTSMKTGSGCDPS